MNIGEKIRELRIKKMMTQADLAGTQITRNMLSCIEHGSALPSLPTVLYLAKRLNLPAGLLLADESEERFYQKVVEMPNIRRAYAMGDYQSCRSLCEALFEEEADDEILLLLADCCLQLGAEAVKSGELYAATHALDDALRYAEKTVYPSAQIAVRANTYFRYLSMVSPTLYSNASEDTVREWRDDSDLAKYLDGLDALSDGNMAKANQILATLPEDNFYRAHLFVRLQMSGSRMDVAKEELLRLLNSSEALSRVQLFFIFGDLEICCKETEDFKGAYLYANEKMGLLEQLLKSDE